MATERSITIREVQSLADRLLSRGVSAFGNANPEQQRDLELAAKCLRALARSFSPGDVVKLGNGGEGK